MDTPSKVSGLRISYFRLFGGLCGLTPRRRRQPSGGDTRAEPVFPTKGRRPPRGRRRRTMAIEALVPPDAARVATRAPSRRNSVHERPKTASRGHFLLSVYTPASPCLSATAQQCTRTPQNGVERPFPPICVHSCVPTIAWGTLEAVTVTAHAVWLDWFSAPFALTRPTCGHTYPQAPPARRAYPAR